MLGESETRERQHDGDCKDEVAGEIRQLRRHVITPIRD
jgi:hypothetical protein